MIERRPPCPTNAKAVCWVNQQEKAASSPERKHCSGCPWTRCWYCCCASDQTSVCANALGIGSLPSCWGSPLQQPYHSIFFRQAINQKSFIQTIQSKLGGVKPSMSPRPYRLGQRQASTEQTRARIIAAARELLVARNGFSGFSIDAVARQADVARMTVYYQFGSKIGLLEALSDSLATHGGMEQLADAFRRT